MKMNVQSYTFRIVAAFAAAGLLFIIALAVAIHGMDRITAGYGELEQHANVRLHALNDMFGNGLFGGIATRNKVFKPQLKAPLKVVQQSGDAFQADLKQVRALTAADDSQSQTLLNDIEQRWTIVQNARLDVLKQVEQKQTDPAITELANTEHPNWQQIRKDLQVLMKAQEQAVTGLGQKVYAQAHVSRRNSIMVGLVAIILGIVVTLLVLRSLRRGLNSTIEAMQAVADGDGDLTRRLAVNGDNELSQLAATFNRFADLIQKLVRQVVASTTQLAAAAEQMSVITGESRAGLERQHRETDQVATAVEEMAATVHEVAGNTAIAADAARDADGEARNGRNTVQQAGNAVQQLAGEVEASAAAIDALAQESQRIGGVLDVIRAIAEQTNLLALNAAIEAARAGENGRGFAVVADEVRTLAGRTQRSTAEIQSMIEALQEKARDAAAKMEAGRSRTTATVEYAEATSASLATIGERVASLSDMNTHIAAAAEEQSAVASEVSRNVSNIKVLTDEAANHAEQMSQAGDNLARLAAGLQSLVQHFKV